MVQRQPAFWEVEIFGTWRGDFIRDLPEHDLLTGIAMHSAAQASSAGLIYHYY